MIVVDGKASDIDILTTVGEEAGSPMVGRSQDSSTRELVTRTAIRLTGLASSKREKKRGREKERERESTGQQYCPPSTLPTL